MTSRTVVAISAYNEPESLANLVDNVRFFLDPEEIIVYDASRERRLTESLDVSLCPGSAPLRWGHLVPFFTEVMRWLDERRIDYDFLVTLHSDMLMIRDGLSCYLDIVMADSEYMAPGYLRTNEWCESRIPYLRRFHYGWRRIWGPLFGNQAPSWAYSPGQVFRRSYVDKALRFPNLDRLLRLADRSRILGVEELFLATLADAMDCNPIRFPEEHGCHQPVVDLPRLKSYVDTPSVYFVHKMSLDPDDPVRFAVNELRHGKKPPALEQTTEPAAQWELDPALPSSGIREHLKDLYFHFFP